MLYSATATAKSLQSCPTLCDPVDDSPPVSTIPGILQARTLEWVAISFSNAWKWKVKVKSLSHVQLSATPWTAAYQAPLSMGFSRQEYSSGVPLPSPVLYSRYLLIIWHIVVSLLIPNSKLSFLLPFPPYSGLQSDPRGFLLGLTKKRHWKEIWRVGQSYLWVFPDGRVVVETPDTENHGHSWERKEIKEIAEKRASCELLLYCSSVTFFLLKGKT